MDQNPDELCECGCRYDEHEDGNCFVCGNFTPQTAKGGSKGQYHEPTCHEPDGTCDCKDTEETNGAELTLRDYSNLLRESAKLTTDNAQLKQQVVMLTEAINTLSKYYKEDMLNSDIDEAIKGHIQCENSAFFSVSKKALSLTPPQIKAEMERVAELERTVSKLRKCPSCRSVVYYEQSDAVMFTCIACHYIGHMKEALQPPTQEQKDGQQ